MYLVNLPDGLYALHAFQKKSKKGIATPRREVELVEKRVDRAVAASRERMQKNG
jgi:phage-related protein